MLQEDAKLSSQEHFPEGKSFARQPGLHCRSLGLFPKLQRSVWPQKVVVAAYHFKLTLEIVNAALSIRRLHPSDFWVRRDSATGRAWRMGVDSE